uniref:Uncharacterized protein n=1 Tax=Lactuca sativa TaxID=4236 RepID=A0A9R1UFF8_LACSA|nr:hypothetical protein LSAT_V11C900481850 [Lactuca sativa]
MLRGDDILRKRPKRRSSFRLRTIHILQLSGSHPPGKVRDQLEGGADLLYATCIVKRAILVDIIGGLHVFVSIAVRKATSELIVLFSVRACLCLDPRFLVDQVEDLLGRTIFLFSDPFPVTPQLSPLRAVVLFVIPPADILHQECDFSCIRVSLVWVRILLMWGVEEVCICVLLAGKAKTITMAANHGGSSRIKVKRFHQPNAGGGWKFLWCKLHRLEFDAGETLNDIVTDRKLGLGSSNRDKRVEMLELDFMKHGIKIRDPCFNYDFPLRLSDRNIEHLCKLPSSTVSVVELISLKKARLEER